MGYLFAVMFTLCVGGLLGRVYFLQAKPEPRIADRVAAVARWRSRDWGIGCSWIRR
jgi:hypothetical protein